MSPTALHRNRRGRPAPKTSPQSVQWVTDKHRRPRRRSRRASILMGHSAGAVHVANYVSHPGTSQGERRRPCRRDLISRLYDLTASPVGDAEITYFGADPSRYAERILAWRLAGDEDPVDVRPPPNSTRPASSSISTCRSRRPASAPAVARAPSCCRSTVICRRSMRSTPQIRELTDEIVEFVKTGKRRSTTSLRASSEAIHTAKINASHTDCFAAPQ